MGTYLASWRIIYNNCLQFLEYKRDIKNLIIIIHAWVTSMWRLPCLHGKDMLADIIMTLYVLSRISIQLFYFHKKCDWYYAIYITRWPTCVWGLDWMTMIGSYLLPCPGYKWWEGWFKFLTFHKVFFSFYFYRSFNSLVFLLVKGILSPAYNTISYSILRIFNYIDIDVFNFL